MRYYIFACLLVAADQLSKLLVRSQMYLGESVSIIGDFFRLTYIQNRGAAFSMFSDQKIILILIPLIVVITAIIILHRKKGAHFSLYLAWSMILAGGIGNLIDRIVLGYVTDMLDFSIFPPVFNIADIGVTAGCGVLVLYVLAGDKMKSRKS